MSRINTFLLAKERSTIELNSRELLREYMNKLGLTDEDLKKQMPEIRSKIRDNKISKIIK